jgi:hypothetical protein
MHFRNSARLLRVGATALLAAAGLAVTGIPAHAADESFLSVYGWSTGLANGVTKAGAKPLQFSVSNFGAEAKGVTVTVDVSKLDKTRVGYVIPDNCLATAGGYTCRLADMPFATTHTFGAPLYSLGEEGPAGTLSVKVTGATPESDLNDNSVDVPVTVRAAGSDLIAFAQDVYADAVVDGDDADETGLVPVKPGHSAVFDWAIYNYGSRPVQGTIKYGFTLPVGTTFAKQPQGCQTQTSAGQALALCETPNIMLRPGEHFTRSINVRVGGDVTSAVLDNGRFYIADADPAEVDPRDQDTGFEVFTTATGGNRAG